MASKRIPTVLGHTETALRELRGATTPDALAGVVAGIWQMFLGPNEIRFLCVTGLMAVDGEYRQDIAISIDECRRRILKAEADAELKAVALARNAADGRPWHTRQLSYKPPPPLEDWVVERIEGWR